ncbi:MAG: metal ABC transporter substrate-binding protein [Bacillota bacterium]
MKKILILLVTLMTVLSIAACDDTTDDGTVVYTTTYPLKFLLDSIGEDVVTVKYVPGSQVHGESHDWSQKEIIDMQDADFLFHVGAGYDTYIEANIDSVFDDQNVELVKMENHIDILEVELIHDHEDEDHGDEEHDEEEHPEVTTLPDAHFWLDTSRMIEASELIMDKLSEKYSDETEILNNNYTVLEAQLQKLHEDFTNTLTNTEKPVVTNVKLFSYFEDAYGLNIKSLTLNAHAHEDETVPNDLETFIDLIIDNDLDYILFEKNATSPAGETLISEVNKLDHDVEKRYLHPIGNITTEEMNQNKNYINLMYDNLASLENALE